MVQTDQRIARAKEQKNVHAEHLKYATSERFLKYVLFLIELDASASTNSMAYYEQHLPQYTWTAVIK